jgi:hypothetical protein
MSDKYIACLAPKHALSRIQPKAGGRGGGRGGRGGGRGGGRSRGGGGRR